MLIATYAHAHTVTCDRVSSLNRKNQLPLLICRRYIYIYDFAGSAKEVCSVNAKKLSLDLSCLDTCSRVRAFMQQYLFRSAGDKSVDITP